MFADSAALDLNLFYDADLHVIVLYVYYNGHCEFSEKENEFLHKILPPLDRIQTVTQ